MKIWKISSGLTDVVAYVQVLESCKIYDTGYAALQLVRGKYPENRKINGYQLVDSKRGEEIRKDIPLFELN